MFTLDETQQTPITPAQPKRESPDSRPPQPNSPQSPDTMPAIPIDTSPALPCPDLPKDSIFNQAAFPSRTKRYAFTPKDTLEAMTDWATNGGTIDSHCNKHNIRFATLLELSGIFPEISQYYAHAQQKHAEIWSQECEQIAEDQSRDQSKVTKINKNGEVTEYMQGNMVATRRDDLRIRTRQWLMERVNERYRPKSETVSRNLNITFNGNMSDVFGKTWEEI